MDATGMYSAGAGRFSRMLKRARKSELLFGFLLTVPALIAVLFVFGYPWFYSLWMSLNDVNFYTKTWTFVGLTNYLNVLRSAQFGESSLRTAYFALMVVVGSIGLGMAMALVLNEEFKSRGIVRSIALMPWAVARVIVAQMWLLIYDSQYGYLNGILYQLGLIDRYVPFLAHGFRALNLIGVTYIWSYAPLCYLLLLAQLQAVPKNLYAAAKVDGANAWQRFWHVTLPWLRPMLLLVLILATIDAIMAFDLFFVLTGGGPGSATTVISWLGYSTAFAFFRMSDGAAILYTLSIICLILAYFYMRLLYRGAEARRRVAVPTAEETASRGVMPSVVGGVGSLEGSRTFARAEVRRSLLGGKVGQRLKSALLYACVVLIAFWSLAPFYTTVLASLLPLPSIIKVPPQWIPIPGTLQNYKDIFFGRIGAGEFGAVKEVGMVLPGIRNSFIVATVVTFVNAIIGGLAGYAYARYARYRVMGASLWVLMMTRMIPALTLVIPMFVIFRRLGIIDTHLGLIIAYTSIILPLTIWIMKGYFETVPISLERAALVDGCTRLQALYRVIVPIARPGIMAAVIFCFILAWNHFLYAQILATSMRSQTIPVVMAGFTVTQRWYSPGVLFASGLLAILFPVGICLIFQRRLVGGMVAGAQKG